LNERLADKRANCVDASFMPLTTSVVRLTFVNIDAGASVGGPIAQRAVHFVTCASGIIQQRTFWALFGDTSKAALRVGTSEGWSAIVSSIRAFVVVDASLRISV